MENLTCYTYDEAQRIIAQYQHYFGLQLNRVPDRFGGSVSGIVQGFLALPLEKEAQDFGPLLAHYLDFILDKEGWLRSKRQGDYCWLPLIRVGDQYLSLPNAMFSIGQWTEEWRKA